MQPAVGEFDPRQALGAGARLGGRGEEPTEPEGEEEEQNAPSENRTKCNLKRGHTVSSLFSGASPGVLVSRLSPRLTKIIVMRAQKMQTEA